MKAIQIDANSVHDENGEIYISTAKVEHFHIKDDEKVLVYEDDEIWNGIIHSFVSGNKTLWYVELCGLCDKMSEQQIEWNIIGFENGYCIGEQIVKSRVIQQMFSLGYDLEKIKEIIPMNEELEDKVIKLFQNNN